MHVCGCVCTCVNCCMCRGSRLPQGSSVMQPTSSKTGSLIGWSSSIRLAWLAHALWGLPSCLPSPEIMSRGLHAQLSVSVLETELPRCFTASNSPTEPPALPLTVLEEVLMWFRKKGITASHSESGQCILCGENHCKGGCARG